MPPWFTAVTMTVRSAAVACCHDRDQDQLARCPGGAPLTPLAAPMHQLHVLMPSNHVHAPCALHSLSACLLLLAV